MSTPQPQYWVVVAARDHALAGVQQGIVQASHGKAAPLRRMQPGDGLVLYAPKRVYGQPEPCQCFVALGTVAAGPVYQASVAENFEPFRRKAEYEPITETPIQLLLARLRFIENKAKWGYLFRLGCFAIPPPDFELLRATMTTHAPG